MLVGLGGCACVGKHVVDRKEKTAFFFNSLLGYHAGLRVFWLFFGESQHFGQDRIVKDVVVGPAGEKGFEDESEPSGDLLIILQYESTCLLLLKFWKALRRVLVTQLQLKETELKKHVLE